jgi:hypothetical protein
MPIVAEMNAYRVRYLEEIRDLLLEAWTTRGRARARLRRAIGHALGSRTWQSLVRRQGCRTNEAVQLLLTFVCAAASDEAGAMKKACNSAMRLAARASEPSALGQEGSAERQALPPY